MESWIFTTLEHKRKEGTYIGMEKDRSIPRPFEMNLRLVIIRGRCPLKPHLKSQPLDSLCSTKVLE